VRITIATVASASYAAIVPIEKLPQIPPPSTPSDKNYSANCYQNPHCALAVYAGLACLLCLALAGWCWSAAGRTHDPTFSGFIILGRLVALGLCLWFVYQAFCLALFCVVPYARCERNFNKEGILRKV
jgi:hypothetical protein